jgi:uncharacterized protein with FMN-binding domain
MKKQITAALASLTVAVPVAGAAAATRTKVTTITKTVRGTAAEADRWGPLQVTLVVRKTTTTTGTKKKVTRKITAVKVPVYPNHTDRSVFINQQAIPMLVQEELAAQFNLARIEVVGGATDTSYAFGQSLQAALAAAKRV